MMVRKRMEERKTLSLRWELPPLLFLFGLWVYFFSLYPTLPQQVVVHIGASGLADGFGEKSFWSAAAVLLIGSGTYLGILLLNRLLIGRAKDFRRYLNLPNKDRIPLEKLEDARHMTMGFLYFINVFVLALLGYLQVEMLRLSLGFEMVFPWAIWLALLVPFVGVIVFIYKLDALTDGAVRGGKKR